jgi:FtsZ-binding cell division protein ZapB
MTWSSDGAKCDILLMAGTAALAVALTATAVVISREKADVSEEVAARKSNAGSAPSESPGSCPGEPCPPGVLPARELREIRDGIENVEQVRLELQDLKEQRSKLQEELRTVGKELRRERRQLTASTIWAPKSGGSSPPKVASSIARLVR